MAEDVARLTVAQVQGGHVRVLCATDRSINR
jgi:hypothetical protein